VHDGRVGSAESAVSRRVGGRVKARLVALLMFVSLGCSSGKSAAVSPVHFVCHVSSDGQSDILNVDLAHASSAQTALFVSSVFHGRSAGFDYLVRFTVRGGVGDRRALVAVSVATDESTRARSAEGRFPFAGSIRLPAGYASLTPVAYDCPSPT
jgi:hypothetical protein